jgi:hypothetical protein
MGSPDLNSNSWHKEYAARRGKKPQPRSRPQECPADRVVRIVRRNDDDRFDAILALGLLFGHLLIARVGPVVRNAIFGRGRLGSLRIRRKRAGHQLVSIVHTGADQVHCAYDRALPASAYIYQAVPEPSTALLLCLGLMALATGRWNR